MRGKLLFITKNTRNHTKNNNSIIGLYIACKYHVFWICETCWNNMQIALGLYYFRMQILLHLEMYLFLFIYPKDRVQRQQQ